MGRGGRSSGGGFRRSPSSYSARRRAPPPAPKPAAAPAPATAGSSSAATAAGYVGATISDGFLWGIGSSIGHRITDGIWGPRKFEVEHTTHQQEAAAAPAASSACLVHALDFQDCVSQNSSDISKCQRLVDILNDCRRRTAGQAAVVETSG